MKTILWNSYYVNPLAYLVFPNIQEPEKGEDYIEPCNIQGQIEIIVGDTRDVYKNVSSIDFSKYKGDRIRIELYTGLGAVVLGEWLIEGSKVRNIIIETTIGYNGEKYSKGVWNTGLTIPAEGIGEPINTYGPTSLKIDAYYDDNHEEVRVSYTFNLYKANGEYIPRTDYYSDYVKPAEFVLNGYHYFFVKPNILLENIIVEIVIGSTLVGSDKWVFLRYTLEPSLTVNYEAGDYCFYDRANDKLTLVRQLYWDINKYPADNYVPIGVVVVPSSHNVYGDGSCGVMSLKSMNCDTPSTGGTSEQYMYWGVYGTDISALPNLNQVPIVGSGSNVGNASSTVTGEEYYAYLPSDKFSAVQCPHDTDAYYYSSSSSYDQAPSPYLTDGSRNPAYYQTSSPSSSSNALSDFDGIGNTERIIAQRGTKDYNSWTPGIATEADYPAASCCDMFHTEGTSQGDWYLPACGELGYIMPPFNKINEAISNMRQAYGSSVGVELSTGSYYWSSTESNSGNARVVAAYDGYVDYCTKYGTSYVRAWLRVGGTKPEPEPQVEYVDLGSPSGLLWAKCNIGATNEEETGLYFQWGDTQGYTAEQVGNGEGQKYFDWDDYKFSIDGSSSNFSKYNASDGKTVLDPEDDAAHVIMGGNWRMPTFEECKELCLNTDIYLVPTEGEEIQGTAQEQSGSIMINWASQAEGTLKGIKFYKKSDKQTYIFVPASGDAVDGSVQGVGEVGGLWSSSLNSSGVQNAWFFGFNALYGYIDYGIRYDGIPVRGVCYNN